MPDAFSRAITRSNLRVRDSSKTRDAPSHPLPLARQTYIVRAAPLKRDVPKSRMGEPGANVPSAGKTIPQLQHPFAGRQRPDLARVKLQREDHHESM
jgi:hypothetical protein